jgi:hypothetical protein
MTKHQSEPNAQPASEATPDTWKLTPPAERFREWLEDKHPAHDWPQPTTGIAAMAEHYFASQPPASEPSGREAVYAKHRKRCERECTRDVIFVFQRRRLRWTGRLPDGYEFRDSFVFLKGDGRVAEPQTLEAIYAAHGSEYAIETWDVESVWLDRDEAEAWAKAHEYNYRDGWRVYGMPADGELAKLLRGEHESQRHPAAPAGEREDNTALQAKLDAVTGLEKKWRAWSRGIGKSPVAAQWAYTRCADDLAAALAGGGK